MYKNLIRKTKENRGFTLMEVLVVIAILAIIVLITIPAVIKMRQDLKIAERNDHAKSIYMAAQSNLTQMRSMGELGMLEQAADADPAVVGRASYVYAQNSSSGSSTSYDLIVPTTLEATVRSQQVIVEYHPKAGIVYSVFYYEGSDSLTSLYSSVDLTTEENQKEYEVGYYCVGSVDELEGEALKVYPVESTITYENGHEGLLTIAVPTGLYKDSQSVNLSEEITGGQSSYRDRLEIQLTITGENGAEQTLVAKSSSIDTTTTSALDYEFATGINDAGISVFYFTFHLDSLASHNAFTNHKSFADLIAASTSEEKLKIGDNVSIAADVTFYPSAQDPIVMIESATIAGINPMYHSLTQNPNYKTEENAQNTEKPYILAISNGRHLQNLTHLDKEFAQQIESIVFTQQAAAQALSPAAEGGITLNWLDTAESYVKKNNNEAVVSADFPFQPIEFKDFSYIPSILGNGVTIQNLTINTAVNGNTGLFATLEGTSIEKITLKNPTVDASAATSSGALIGTAKNVTIKNCNVTTENPANTTSFYISGKGNVGGLIGTATGSENTNMITNCSSSALVHSVDGSQSNVGGLVGYSDGTDYTSCSSSATVRGGIFVDLSNSEYSYLGGLVGLAKNANLNNTTSSASVKGTNNTNDAGNYIPQSNYIGGLIGRAESCTLEANVNATLSDMPSYAYGAGGLLGYMDKGTINAAGVTLHIGDAKPAKVQRFGGLACNFAGVKMETTGEEEVKIQINGTLQADKAAGAIVGISNSSGTTPELENIHVVVDGSVIGNEAAGFAIEAGGKIDKCYVIPKSTDSMNINGTTSSAGFILTNKANITNSYVLGNVVTSSDGSAAGFALTNSASIKQCFANVSVSDNHAFVKNVGDNSVIKDCYGWLWDNTSTSALKISKNCAYSYFVNGKTDSMVFYEELGSSNNSTESGDIINTDALSDQWAVQILNEGTPSNGTPVWENPNGGYPYPELKTLGHKGSHNDPKGGNYSYGILYVENNGDGIYMTDLSNNGKIEATLDNVGEVTSAQYYVYHRTASNTPSGLGSAQSYNKFGDLELNQLYSIYPVTGTGNVTIDFGNNEKISLNTYYGPINSDGYYRVRTSDHFKNIKHNSDSKFVLEKDVAVSETISSFSGSLSRTAGTITTTVPLFGTLSGTLTDLDVVATIDAGENTYGIIANTLNGGTLTNCDILTGSSITGSQAAVYVGNAQSGTFSGCDATVDSSLPFANFKPKGTINENAEYISRYDFGESKTQSLTAAALSMTKLEGKTFDTVTAEITIGNCTLNGSAVTLTTAYYYSVSDYTYSMSDAYTEFFTMKDADPTFEDVVDGDTVYYVRITDDVYEQITDASIDTSDDSESILFSYYTTSLGSKTVTITSSSDKVSKAQLKLYTKQNNELSSGTYFIFNSDSSSVLVYNENSYEWEAYSTTYRTDMVWIYDKSSGTWENAYLSDGTIRLGDITGSKLVQITFTGSDAVTCKLRSVSVYKTVTKVDTANILNPNDLPS